MFFAAEITAYQPGALAALVPARGWATAPWAALSLELAPVSSTATIRVSDLGYRTRESDPDGLQVYPPTMTQAFEIDRAVNIDPTASSISASWGTIEISNADRSFDTIARAWNSDSRPVKILAGTKSIDPTMHYPIDPPYGDLSDFFAGVAGPWLLSGTALSIPIYGSTYWLSRPIQSVFYLGTGGLQGTPDMAGQPVPIARGGKAGAPISNVTPTLVDPVALIYQYTDAAGTVIGLFEGGAAVFVYDGDVADLHSGTVAPGHYRTCNALGLFQLGSTPVHAITADITGEFPIAGEITTLPQIARYLLTETLLLPLDNIDLDSFSPPIMTSSYARGWSTAPWTALSLTDGGIGPADPVTAPAGVYFATTEQVDGSAALQRVLSGFGSIIENRRGQIALMRLRAIPSGAVPVASFDTANILEPGLSPAPLPPAVDPPVYRVSLGGRHNYTVQTSDISPSADPGRQILMANADALVTWSSEAVLNAYLRPNVLAPISTALLHPGAARALADSWGELFGVQRRLYDMPVPVPDALDCDLGDIVAVKFPIADLDGGRLARVVSDSYRSTDGQITLRVLI